MPWGWIMFSTATSPDLEPFSRDPVALADYVKWIVENSGATFKDVYFEVGAERAYALVKDLDNYDTARAVTRILGATGYVKLLDPAQAKDALTLEDELRSRTPPKEE
jgi:hypothetical protein